jgi:hypothetical protein
VNGFWAFARKEAVEIVRTWRIWVLPSILLFFAVTGPVTARFTPQIIGAVGGTQLAGLKLPAPTYVDAYLQWAKNLTQIALIAIIVIYGGLVSSERKSGTAVLVLTKPLSRTAFVVAKAVVHAAFLSVTVVLGTLVTWDVTKAIFGRAPVRYGPRHWPGWRSVSCSWRSWPCYPHSWARRPGRPAWASARSRLSRSPRCTDRSRSTHRPDSSTCRPYWRAGTVRRYCGQW